MPRSGPKKKRPVFPSLFLRRIAALLKQPIFIFLTIAGHTGILLGALAIYWAEGGVNPGIRTPVDALFWAFSTVTTVGYANNAPITELGKVIAILVMMMGMLFLWSYVALFTSALIAPELQDVERDVKELESGVKRIEHEVDLDEQTTQALAQHLRSLLQHLERKQEPATSRDVETDRNTPGT